MRRLLVYFLFALSANAAVVPIAYRHRTLANGLERLRRQADSERSISDVIDSVSPAQIQQFANELLAGRPSIIIAGDAKKFLDAVNKEFPDAEVIPASSVK